VRVVASTEPQSADHSKCFPRDPAFSVLFAEYARTFARRYSWVR
jgi:hypothetical protein